MDPLNAEDTVEFNLDTWGAENKLTEATLTKLKDQDIDNIEALKALTPSDVSDLALNIGQRALFRKALGKLQGDNQSQSTPATGYQPSPPAPVATTKSLAKNKQLNELLSAMESDLLPGLLSKGAGYDAGDAGRGSGYQYDPTSSITGKKALRIPDFITTNLDACEDDYMEEVGSVKGGKLMICRESKPKVTDVTLPEWISANARILIKLIDSQDITTLQEVKEYMEYTKKIGDHARENFIPTVMRFDDKFRKDQAQKSWSWDHDDPFLLHNNLIKRPTSYGGRATNASQGRQASRNTPNVGRQAVYDSRGREICRQFQSTNGCSRPGCIYSHVCMAPGCEGQHPRCQHGIQSQSGSLSQAMPFSQPPPQFGRGQGVNH